MQLNLILMDKISRNYWWVSRTRDKYVYIPEKKTLERILSHLESTREGNGALEKIRHIQKGELLPSYLHLFGNFIRLAAFI